MPKNRPKILPVSVRRGSVPVRLTVWNPLCRGLRGLGMLNLQILKRLRKNLIGAGV